jgi:amino acid adenylation domain-containing protein
VSDVPPTGWAPTAVDDGPGRLPAPAEPLQPLGPRQYAFWILQQLAPTSAVSNLSIVLRTARPLRWWPLHAAVEHLVARHPALRTRFPAAAGVPLRHVSRATDVVLDVAVDATGEDGLHARLSAEAATAFDLATELPFRVSVHQLDDGGTALHLVIHHIVSDALSVAELTGELARAYDGVAAGTGVPADLAGELAVPAEAASSPEDVRYWSQVLRGVDVDRLALPGGRPAPARPTFAGATFLVDLAPATCAALATLRRTGATNNIVLLAAYALTLVRHGAGPDLVLGVPVADRGGPARGLGFRVSTLPLRIQVDPGAGFAALVRQVRSAFLDGAQHASASVEEILAELGHQATDWRVPLFRHMFNYRPWDESDISIAGERPTSPTVLRPESRLDLQLTVLDRTPAPQLVVNHSTEIHDRADVVALVERMMLLLQAAAREPDRPVAELDMGTDAERAVLDAANDTARPELLDATVPDRLRAVADPAAVAVADGGTEHTYGDLARSAAQVATALRAVGTGPGDVVGLALPRGAAAIAAVLGVWSLGACYLPLDLRHPAQRTVAQLADVAVTAVLAADTDADTDTDADRTGALAGTGVRIVPWSDVEGAEPATGTTTGSPAPDDPAYLIHTSGSTGRPRGVVITHRNLANVVADFADRLRLSARDAVLWSTTPAFDISGLEMCLPLTVGGRVVVAGPDVQTDPRELLAAAVAHDVAVLQATPTFWRSAVGEAGDALQGRTVLCGGEPLPAELARDLLATGCRLLNVYGPTETTIWSTVQEIDGPVPDPVPVGRPIANTTVTVVDEHGASLPPGMLGELCIGGAGLAVGYAGQPELTAERFPSGPGGRRYRTGDLGRWLPDGTLELFGRNDRQVKLRGHRIELPEIEAVLRGHPLVSDAVAVVAAAGTPEARLRAFVQPVAGAPSGLAGQLWDHAGARLPSAALPSEIQVVDAFPTTPNGKVDHRALRARDGAPEPAAAPSAAGTADPALTGRLLALWREVLSRPALDEHAHFFLNGGHSLLAARLAVRVAETEGRDVGLRAVFDHPTAARLADHLAGSR